MKLLEVVNTFTNKVYCVKESEINNSIVELYGFNGTRLTVSKWVSSDMLKKDYEVIAELELE